MGKLLLEKEKPHRCPLPAIKLGAFNVRYNPGTIWQCDCGRYYLVKGKYWRQISERKARKLMNIDGTSN